MNNLFNYNFNVYQRIDKYIFCELLYFTGPNPKNKFKQFLYQSVLISWVINTCFVKKNKTKIYCSCLEI